MFFRKLLKAQVFFEYLHRHRLAVLAGWAALVALVLGMPMTHRLAFTQNLENDLIDFRFHLRGPLPPRPDIVIVGVKASSFNIRALAPDEAERSPALAMMRPTWPWNRAFHGHVLDRLVSAGAKGVLFDFLFRAPADGDDNFADAIARAGQKVTLASIVEYNQSVIGERGVEYKLPNDDLLPENDDGLYGFVNVWPDSDGVVRRVRTGVSLIGEMRPDQPPPNPDHFSITAVASAKLKGTAPGDGSDLARLVHFAGPSNTYPIIAVEDLFLSSRWNTYLKGGAYFRDKFVLVGPIAEDFKDYHTTPFRLMAGVELQANILATLLEDRLLHEPPRWIHGLIAVAMTGAGLLLCLRAVSALLRVSLLLVLAMGYMALTQMLFEEADFVAPVVFPLLGLVLSGGFGVVYDFMLEQYERSRVRNILDRYVTPQVANIVLSNRESFEQLLRGQKQPVVIMFSDIRGFTTLSESRSPEVLVAQLNEYFLVMVDIVLKQGGTLQKYIGDAILAAWGDTHSLGAREDACRAVRTTLAMRDALARLNQKWAQMTDRLELSIGIGLNYGDAVVGNIGHPQRMEFTVLGDAVNLASRLESATKQFHQTILIGQTVHGLTKDDFIYRHVDRIMVKGKHQAVDVYTPIAERPGAEPPWLATYHEALALYHAAKFEEARERFKAVAPTIGTEDFLCEMYIERCAYFLENRPAAGWAGEWKLTEK